MNNCHQHASESHKAFHSWLLKALDGLAFSAPAQAPGRPYNHSQHRHKASSLKQHGEALAPQEGCCDCLSRISSLCAVGWSVVRCTGCACLMQA